MREEGRVNLDVLGTCLREYFFPSGCAICGKALYKREDAWYGLCEDCRRLFSLEDAEYTPRCRFCGRPLISETNLCVECRTGDHYVDQVRSLFPYSGHYRRLLGGYKFEGRRNLANILKEKIIQGLSLFPGLSGKAVLVPVPPRPGKIRKSGWDQIDYLGKLLGRSCRRAGGELGLSVYPCLRRLPSKTQKSLDRAGRQTNLLGRIRAVRQVPAEPILFDDVITTGSTLDACAAALKAAGAQKVYGLCLFYD